MRSTDIDSDLSAPQATLDGAPEERCSTAACDVESFCVFLNTIKCEVPTGKAIHEIFEQPWQLNAAEVADGRGSEKSK